MNPSPDASADTHLTRVSASADTYIRDTPLLTPPADTPLAGPTVQLAALAHALGGAAPACAAEPDLWHDDDTRQAIKVCRRCPARPECEAYARTNAEQHGVWGGVSFGRRSSAPPRTAPPTTSTTPTPKEKKP